MWEVESGWAMEEVGSGVERARNYGRTTFWRKRNPLGLSVQMQPTISSPHGTVKAPLARPVLPEPLRSWSGTRSDFPRDASAAAVFEEVAQHHPDAVARVQGNVQLTYEQLNVRANRFAGGLHPARAKPETMAAC